MSLFLKELSLLHSFEHMTHPGGGWSLELESMEPSASAAGVFSLNQSQVVDCLLNPEDDNLLEQIGADHLTNHKTYCDILLHFQIPRDICIGL